MGHRSYLYLEDKNRAKKQTKYLFESNNSLPFFWLLLIDRQMLNDKIVDWKDAVKYEKNHTEEETEEYLKTSYSGDFKIDKLTFEKNSQKNRKYLEKKYPTTLPLYDDFIAFISVKFNENNHLKMDITQQSAFYDSLDDFCTILQNELQIINKNKSKSTFLETYDLIAFGTGFTSLDSDEFKAYPTYIEAQKNRKAPSIKDKKTFDKKSLIVNIIILLLCPFFSLLAYRIFKSDGISFNALLTTLLNLGFYIFSIWGIVGEIIAYREIKK